MVWISDYDSLPKPTLSGALSLPTESILDFIIFTLNIILCVSVWMYVYVCILYVIINMKHIEKYSSYQNCLFYGFLNYFYDYHLQISIWYFKKESLYSNIEEWN